MSTPGKPESYIRNEQQRRKKQYLHGHNNANIFTDLTKS